MQIVNGYPCFSCADVSKAKQNVDPKDKNDPAQAAASQQAGSQPAGAPQTGILQAGAAPPDGVNRPLTEGSRGTLLNLSA